MSRTIERPNKAVLEWRIKAAAARDRLERIDRVLRMGETPANKLDLIQMILDEPES